MATEVQSIHVVLPLAVGLVIGIVEAYFVYEGERNAGSHQVFGDMWHGLLFAMFGVLVASNVPYVISQGWVPEFLMNIPGFVDANGNSLIISILITLFMMVKMVSTRAIKGVRGGGFTEKFHHKLIIALAVGFAPYYIMYLYEPLMPLQNLVPWLPF